MKADVELLLYSNTPGNVLLMEKVDSTTQETLTVSNFC